jgi:hypothetical protein
LHGKLDLEIEMRGLLDIPPGVLTYGVATFLRSYDLGLEYFVPKVPEITSFFNQKKIKETEKHREIFPWGENGSIFIFILSTFCNIQ